jgi:predicted RNA-binding Zn-ribbon protein involved in translation (DUF1610 family)
MRYSNLALLKPCATQALRYSSLALLKYGRLGYEFHNMTVKQPTSRFDCPNCGAQYTLVRVEVESVEADGQIACRICGGALNGHDGRFILKYFLVDRPTRADRSRLADRARREAQRQRRN